MSMEWNSGSSNTLRRGTETVELELSKSTLRIAERKTDAYSYKSREQVLQEAIGEGIDRVI